MRASFCQLLSKTSRVALLALLVLAGCSTSNNPLTSQVPAGTSSMIPAKSFIPLTFTRPTHAGVLTKPVSTTNRVLAATGGAVLLPGAIYNYSLSVPPGALQQDTDLSITVPDDAKALTDMGPEGTRFATPVTFSISIDVTGTNYGLLKKIIDIYWYNPATGMWEAQGATISKQGSVVTARAKFSHFSQYALGGE